MSEPAPVSLGTPNVLELQFIKVSVRTDFRRKKGNGVITFDWDGEVIAGAEVQLLEGVSAGAAEMRDSAVTDSQGWATIETSQLPDGDYIIRIKPQHSFEELAGPAIAETGPLQRRLYHPLDVSIKLAHGLVASATIDDKVRFAGLGNRMQQQWPPDAMPTYHLPIDLKPTWMLGGRAATATTRTTDKIELVVIHNTGADTVPEARIGSDINTFITLPPPPPPGKAPEYHEIHYLMDLNGHVIKFMRDSTVSFQAGGKWKGKSSNDISIGIEVVHKEEKTHNIPPVLEYTDDQYAVLLEFLERLSSAYWFDRSQIAGHSDVGTRIWPPPIDYELLDGSRDQDPGQIFRWEKLEADGWGMIPQDLPLGDAYGGLFNLADAVVLRLDESDPPPAAPNKPAPAPHYGGKNRPGVAGTVIRDLQKDLAQIGYSLHVNGQYDKYTHFAVAAFQRHFFSGSRRRKAVENGLVDKGTAQMIKNVIAAQTPQIPGP
jgi:N-acetyl-anhydromuramyl-L-alanine amidase AmpD